MAWPPINTIGNGILLNKMGQKIGIDDKHYCPEEKKKKRCRAP